MAHYDDLAIGVVLAAKDLGIAVPEELSVMGCDDGPAAIASDLTTIRQPFRESGAMAVRVLVAMINSSALSRSIVTLPVEVIERSTTRPAAAKALASRSKRGAAAKSAVL